jgi:glucose-6-phosphate isomerase
LKLNLDRSFFSPELCSAADNRVSEALNALTALKNHSCRGGEFTGWFDYPQLHGFDLNQKIRTYRQKLDFEFDCVVVIGIGGSYLGTRTVAEALQNEYLLAQKSSDRRHKPIFYAGHQLTGNALMELLSALDGFSPMVNVISKSGTTTEPSVAFRVLRSYMEKRYGAREASQRIVATTDEKKGALRQFADANGYISFPVPDDVGGRFSVLTAVGLVPLMLAGYQTEELLKGADLFFSEVRNGLSSDHPVIQYATSRKAAYEHGRTVEVQSIIDPKLRMLSEWWKQLFGESEGKEAKGIFPASICLTTDLHSMGQYVQQGTRMLFESFVSFRTSRVHSSSVTIPVQNDDRDQLLYLEGKTVDEVNEAAKLATKIAHADGDVPCLDLEFDEPLSERSLGYAFAFFETACGISAQLLGVNPFDQPGVEDYKKNLFALMGRKGYEELAKSLANRIRR